MVRLGRNEAENFAKAVEVVERVLGPLGEVEVLSHLNAVGGSTTSTRRGYGPR